MRAVPAPERLVSFAVCPRVAQAIISGVDTVSDSERTRQLRRHDERLAELRGLL